MVSQSFCRRWLQAWALALLPCLAMAETVLPLRPSLFVESMREPVMCEDLVDVGFSPSGTLAFQPLRRPIGGLILRRQETDWVQACAAGQPSCHTTGCGRPITQRCLGVAYALGLGVGKDLSRARNHFDFAAVDGDAWSARQAAAMTWHMGVRAREDFYRRLEALATQGEPIAARVRGHLFLNDVTLLDRNQARTWFERGARLGDAQSMCALATLQATGPVRQRDYVASLDFLTRAADVGDADALSNLGLFKEFGRAGIVDLAGALQLYMRAARAGSPSGQRNLAIALERQAKEPQLVRDLYRAAAAAGDVVARHKLGLSTGAEAVP
jgi:TPR repeat protein